MAVAVAVAVAVVAVRLVGPDRHARPRRRIGNGSTATWTIAVTNAGGAYLYAVGISDALSPSCGTPSAFSDTLSFMAPNVTVTYTCSISNVTASFTNTVAAGATTGPGPTISTTATASVTVQAVPTPAPTPRPPPSNARPGHHLHARDPQKPERHGEGTQAEHAS